MATCQPQALARFLPVILLLCLACPEARGSFFNREQPWATSGAIKPFIGCETSAYPPNPSSHVATYDIDLSLQPHQRWTALVTEKKQELVTLVNYAYTLMKSLLGQRAFNFLLNNVDKVTATLPLVYRQEMAGIAEASGLKASEVTLYNIFYELFTFCTSIVAQDQQGRIYHGRNLDFGLFLGWNSSSHEWRVAELLRPLVVQLNWHRANSVLFSSVNYVGYVGVMTAVKKSAFSLTVDERFSWNGGYVGLLEWIMFGDHQQRWVSFLTRDVLETASSYTEARDMLLKPRLLAPVYFIVAGVQSGEGCIITRYRDGYDLLSVGSPGYLSQWYLVQTNYDHWKQPPFYDDRRGPAITCLNNGTATQAATAAGGGDRAVTLNEVHGPPAGSNATLSLLYNVLSTRPVLNKLTTYTSLMSASDGSLDSWIRTCPDPCWPW